MKNMTTISIKKKQLANYEGDNAEKCNKITIKTMIGGLVLRKHLKYCIIVA